jgi:serine/tyrosine/threonine adenylyltransferase
LIAKWMLVGFIHGVMNTDNMSIAGETIDYGPCAFMDTYHPATVYSSIDEGGRYAFANQPRIAQWNLARLAEALLPLMGADQDEAVKFAQGAIESFGAAFERAYVSGLRRKLGLFQSRPDDPALIQDLLERMAENGADFTLTFRSLCDAATSADGDEAVRGLFKDENAFDSWAKKWRTRLVEDGGDAHERRNAMRAVNPRFIPRNHRVEDAIQAAVKGDFAPFETLVAVLSRPFDDQPGFERYANRPQPEEVVHQTFCGT